jgi:ubiquinone/menaquinone biosynthesis C-methylase UbiE
VTYSTRDEPGRLPVSVIILTLNEDINIRECIATLSWADEVIVVDSHSTDRTIELARQCRPDVRIFSNAFQDFGQQRNWALDHAAPRHPWILMLDADERCPPAFVEGIKNAICTPGDKVGFFLCYRNMFLGRWIKHCTLYPSWQLRLLKAGCVRFQKEGHGQREVTAGQLGYLSEPYDHFGFSKGVAEWIERHNSYSTHEVELVERLRSEPLRLFEMLSRDAVQRRRFGKRLATRLPLRWLMHFLYLYIVRLGFLDGHPGLMFCLLRAAHDVHITVKLAELAAARRGATAEQSEPAPRTPADQPRGATSGAREDGITAATLTAAPEHHADIRRPAIEYYDRLAERWNSRYAKRRFSSRSQAILALLGQRDLRNQKWLDAGCGTGTLARLLAERGGSVLGVDASEGMIRRAMNLTDTGLGCVAFCVLDTIESLPFEPSTFEGVLCSSVIEYLEDPGAALEEFRRVLKPGGVLVASVPNRRSILRIVHKLCFRASRLVSSDPRPRYMAFSKREFSPGEFSAFLAAHGFRMVRHALCGLPLGRYLDRWSWGGPLLFALADRVEDADTAVVA